MTVRAWLKLAAAAIAVALAMSIYFAWRGQRREQAELQEKLKSAQQQLEEANARETAREAELTKQLEEIQKKKEEVQTPEQVVATLPEVLPLPKPLLMEAGTQSGAGAAVADKGKPESPSPQVQMPVEDLKPLYDSALECQACQAQLKAAQGDLADEKVKSQALSKERDDALTAAKGGSVLRRVVRAAKWFAIGAAAGAVVAKLGK